jgi:fatty-acyl-CoA synthase
MPVEVESRLTEATLARFKVPRHVIFIEADELPLTAAGKVRKFLPAHRARDELLGERSPG